MRVLVAGGAGFLGSHLVGSLLALKHEVLVVDNLYTGRKSNLRRFLNNPNLEFLRHDITFPLYVEVDGVLNLACPASPEHYQRNPVQTFKTNVIGTTNLLGLAKRLRVPFLLASTSEIYGDPQVSPQNEEYWGHVNPIGMRSCYDEGKRGAETLTKDYGRQFDLDVRIARIFNTYGPHMLENDGRVVSNFIVQALRGNPLTIYGSGNQTRSFCFVDDLIDGLIKLFFTQKITEPINLGNPEPITVKQLASEVIQLTGSNSAIEFHELPSDDPQHREPDITRAKSLLGWEPKTSRQVGLAQTVDYFKGELKL